MEQLHQQWADVLWKYYFFQREHPSPVYLGMDDEEFAEMAKQLDSSLTIEQAKLSLSLAVRGQLQLNLGKSMILSRITDSAKTWCRESKLLPVSSVSAPPQLPFLAVSVMAAQQMGAGEKSPLAYYSILTRVLGLDETLMPKLRGAYMSEIESLWKYLNSLLLNKQGLRGIPTAMAVTNRYVSIPASQAIVRFFDRRKLAGFFIDSELTSDSTPSEKELTALFEWWLSRGYHSISANFSNLWGRGGQTKSRLLEVIRRELDAWDGNSPADLDAPSNRSNRARIVLRRDTDWLGKTIIEIRIACQIQAAQDKRLFLASVSGLGSEVLDLNRLGVSSYFELDISGSFSPGALLMSKLKVEASGLEPYTRDAKGLVALGLSSELQAYVEIDKPVLGQNLILLASKANCLAEKVDAFLRSHANSSLSELSEKAHGIPGWRVFQDVVFENPISPLGLDVGLLGLIPPMTTQLSIDQGLSLPEGPGTRVWSNFAPLTIAAYSPGGENLRVAIMSEIDDGGNPVKAIDSGEGLAVIRLKPHQIKDGDYKVRLYSGSDAKPRASRSFRLRSNETPRKSELHPGLILGYPEIGEAVAMPGWGSPQARWAGFPKTSGKINSNFSNFTTPVPVVSGWVSEKSAPRLSVTHKPDNLPMTDVTSCSFTGAHKWELGTCAGQQIYVDAVCLYCGEFRPELCQARRADAEWASSTKLFSKPTNQSLEAIEVVQNAAPSDSVKLRALAKSLGYLKRGQYKEIREAGASLGLDVFEIRNFVRAQEVAGNIEIENHFDEAATWSLNPTSLVKTADGGYRITGDWPWELIQEFAAIWRDEQNADLTISDGIISADTASKKVAFARFASDKGVPLVERPWENLMGHITPISNLVSERALSALPEGSRTEILNEASGVWNFHESGRIGREGAYKVTGGFFSEVFFVPKQGVEQNKGYRLDAISAKYLACHAVGKPLMSFDSERKFLDVPFGMSLPGLYGRLACSFSGESPITVRIKSGSIEIPVCRYENIEGEVARIIFWALGGK